jgi:hypothetical protein
MVLKLNFSHQGNCRLRVFEDQDLKRSYGSKREEPAVGWRKLYKEELHNYTAHHMFGMQ